MVRFLKVGTALFLSLYYACAAAQTSRSAATSAQLNPIEDARITNIVQAARARHHLVSITAEARRDGRVIYAKSLGYADLQDDVPATPQALYAIGSITKSLTSFCILNLVNEGKLTLNSKIGDILPYYNGPSRDVTILELLTHTSGVVDYAGNSGRVLFGNPVNHYTEREIVDEFKGEPLVFKPRTHWQYSNSGYYLLGLVIEKITGQSYGEAVRHFLLKPFGLNEVAEGQRAAIIKSRVMGYTINASGKIQNASAWGAVLPLGAGSFLASADDLTRYVADLFGDKVPAGVHKMMFHRVSLSDGTLVNYVPAALVESDFYGHQKFTHAGGIWGFITFLSYYPKDGLAIAVMVNTDNVDRAKDANVPGIERKIARVLLGIPQPRVVSVPLDAAEAANYVGTYVMPEYPIFSFPRGRLHSNKAWSGSSNIVSVSYSHNMLYISLEPDLASSVKCREGENANLRQKSAAIELLDQGDGHFVEQVDHEEDVDFTRAKSGHASLELSFEGWPFIGTFVDHSVLAGSCRR